MTLRECKCQTPVQHVNPNRPDSCVRCGYRIDPDWTTNDRTTGAFYDHLAACEPTRDDDWYVFRAQCEARELAGRKHFRHRHLGRDNLHDGCEEAADLANYAFFHTLVLKRAGEPDEDYDLALIAANYAFLAHQTLREIYRRQNTP